MRDGVGAGTSEAQFVRRVLIVIALVALALLAWMLRSILLMVFGAVVVATLFRAFAEAIGRWTRLPPNLSLLLSVLIVATVIGSAGALFGGQIIAQAEGLSEAIPKAWESLKQRLAGFGLGGQLDQLTGTASKGGGMASTLGSFAMSLGGGLTDALLIVVGGIFLAAQPAFYRTGLIKLVPDGKRDLFANALEESGQALKLWLKAQLLTMLIIGVLTGLGLWLIGVPSALALGLLAALLEFIPFVGPILAAVPAVLLALAIDPQLALWTVGLYVVIQQIEGYALSPLIQQWAVDLPGAILIFSLIAFGTLFGALGIVFAAPLTVVCYVLVKRLYVRETLHTETPIPGEEKV
ncbi:AI-2E family transporter [Sphingomonas sp. GCM10030256]|uniref:AI-2E family transporter n=1 Tax=Sphingomonas sp. GCM10030256 TaxID=3273427 RepID=UPI00360D45FB